MRRPVVTGAGTGGGKTGVTAAIAAIAAARGQTVAVVKPTQTGVAPGDEPDVEAVRRLSGVQAVHEFVRYRDPLAPATAAQREGVVPATVTELVERINGLGECDLMLVEGAGGLLVRLDASRATIADLALAISAEVVV